MNSTQRIVEAERERRREREAEQRTKLIQGIILAPVLMLGWYPIVWVLSKFLR